MKPVSNWRAAWKWHSAQILALLAAAPLAWTQLPNDLKDAVPAEWMPYIASGVAIAGLLGRLRDQS